MLSLVINAILSHMSMLYERQGGWVGRCWHWWREKIVVRAGCCEVESVWGIWLEENLVEFFFLIGCKICIVVFIMYITSEYKICFNIILINATQFGKLLITTYQSSYSFVRLIVKSKGCVNGRLPWHLINYAWYSSDTNKARVLFGIFNCGCSFF